MGSNWSIGAVRQRAMHGFSIRDGGTDDMTYVFCSLWAQALWNLLSPLILKSNKTKEPKIKYPPASGSTSQQIFQFRQPSSSLMVAFYRKKESLVEFE